MFPPSSRVLVVDDMNTMRQLVKAQLKGMGFTIFFEADNGENAFKVLSEQFAKNEPIDFVLSDWNMPVMTGLEFVKKCRSLAEYKNLPIMLVTAEGEQHQVIEAIKSGVSNYLVKPFTPTSVQEKVAAMYKRHNPAK